MTEPTNDQAEQIELKLPGEARSWQEITMWAGVLALLTLITYWPSTAGQFLPRDLTVTGNDEQLLARPGGLGFVWSADARPSVRRYTPVAFTIQWVAYRLGGADTNHQPTPLAYHVIGVIALTAAAVLLWFVLRELSVVGSWAIAALAAVHPIAAAAGSSIADSNIAIAAALGWGSVYLYLLFVNNREVAAVSGPDDPPVDPAQTWGFYAGAVACAVLASLSSPVAVVVPILTYLGLWWRRRTTGQDVPLLTAAFLPMLVVLLATFDGNRRDADAMWLLSVFGQSLANSILHLVAPIGMTTYHVDPPTSPGWRWVVIAAVAVAVIGAMIGRKKIGRAATAAVVGLAAALCFGINWTDPTIRPVTDAAAIFAVPVFAAIVVCAVRRGFARWADQPGPAVGATVLVLLCLAVVTVVRGYAYRTDIAYWRDAVAHAPNEAPFVARCAEAYRLDAATAADPSTAVETLKSAIQQAEAAVKLDPNYPPAQRTWANALVSSGEVKAAQPHFRRAVEMTPTNGQLRMEYASALMLIGDRTEARRQLKAVDVAKPPPLLFRLLGRISMDEKKFDEAVAEFKTARDIDPSDADAAQGMAEALTGRGRPDDYDAAIRIYATVMNDPAVHNTRADLWEAWASTFKKAGRFDAAVEALKNAAAIEPSSKKIADELIAAKATAATQPSTRPTTTTRSSQ